MPRRHAASLVLSLACFCPALGAADPVTIARDWRVAHEQQIIDDFAELLSIPNVASDSENIRRNAFFIRDLLQTRGFTVDLLEVAGSPPVVFADRPTPGADATLMIYVHYDGQPANGEDWASEPWTPVLRDAPVEQGGRIIPMEAPFDPESRLFARSAGDDKAPIAALLATLDALDAASVPLSVNLKLFLEGEEEAGSPHLAKMLAEHGNLLAADLWLFCDGPVLGLSLAAELRCAWQLWFRVDGLRTQSAAAQRALWQRAPIPSCAFPS
jgi:acetylornithine deacetylase/succinyl-diaminopimelate desuccinylase-like protein